MHSAETRKKIGDALRKRIVFSCDNCGMEGSNKPSHYARKIRHFCSMKCYAAARTGAPPETQPTWRGGVTSAESHRRWKAKNPERMAHLKARRYARKRGAQGSHSLEEWESLKLAHNNKCAKCGEEKMLTKDHKIAVAIVENGQTSKTRNCSHDPQQAHNAGSQRGEL